MQTRQHFSIGDVVTLLLEVYKCNVEQGGDGRRKKSFRLTCFSCIALSGCLCFCCSSSLTVFFSFQIPHLESKSNCCSKSNPMPHGHEQDYLYKQIYPTGFCCMDTVLPTEQLYNIQLYICV